MAAIVVAGGGVAGLSCAWRLQQTGHDVEVLEAQPEPGGRMRSERRSEFVIERGTRFIASGSRHLQSVAAALGMEAKLRPPRRSQAAILRDAQLLPAGGDGLLRILRSPLLSSRAKLRLPRLLFELRRHRDLLDPLRPERAAALDGEDAEAFLRRTAGAEAFELFETAIASYFGCAPAQLSAAWALLMLKQFGNSLPPLSFQGGNGSFTRALAGSLSVRLRCEVVSVETQPDGALARYRTASGAARSVIADAAVVAIPGSDAPRICPRLVPGERAFFERVRYARGIVVHLALDERPETLPYFAVAFPPSARLSITSLTVDHHRAGIVPAGAGLLSAALAQEAADRLWSAPDAEVAAHVVERLARTPIGRLAVREAVVQRQDPLLLRFQPGYLSHLARFLGRRQRTPRLAFAGDYLVGPHCEGALLSGLRAAEELDARLGAKRESA